MPMYDLCIVGAGMIGSAAARHASITPHTRVCLIGPREPASRCDTSILGAYFDEGRITRCSDGDPIWAEMAERSIARYRDIEEKTGINFYKEVGCVTVRQNNITKRLPSKAKIIDADTAKSKYPYFSFNSDDVIVDELENAGYINPRKMVLAQLTAANVQGCDIIRDVVSHVTEHKSSNGEMHIEIRCENGCTIVSRRVLIATGAFTGFRSLLPTGIIPDLRLVTQSVIFVEVSERDLDSFRKMPSGLFGNSEDSAFDVYLLPPILYPNGKYYIKLGHGSRYEEPIDTETQVADWYNNPPPGHVRDGLLQMFRATFPDFRISHVMYDTCVVSRTASRRPFIDLVTSQIGIALGGNGYAAKSCDEIARLATDLLMKTRWDFPFPQEEFKLKCKQQYSKI